MSRAARTFRPVFRLPAILPACHASAARRARSAWAAMAGFSALAVLAACGPNSTPFIGSPGPEARADAALRESCRRQANTTYEKQNRDAIYAPSSGVNTPFSSNFVPGQTDRGLSAQFAHDQMIRDCIRSNGVATNSNVAGPEPASNALPVPPPAPGTRAPR